VASLWPADDDVAVDLAETFYTALKGGANKAAALQGAQLAMKARAAEGYDHPYFWAPFALWGNY
jgi:CHAT domain-containing protein